MSLDYDESHFKMDIPELVVNPGEVCAVVGQVGCGKSSVINAVLGHMNVRHGSLEVGGTTGYVPQQAWLQNLSLRENITFGYTFDQVKYNRVVEACALKMDFEIETFCNRQIFLAVKHNIFCDQHNQKLTLSILSPAR